MRSMDNCLEHGKRDGAFQPSPNKSKSEHSLAVEHGAIKQKRAVNEIEHLDRPHACQ